jgi:hypothetical protein
MKPILAILLLLMGAAGGVAQSSRLGTFKFEKARAGNRAIVTFRTRAFQPRNHKIVKDASYQTRVDGRLALGTDGNVPNVEISRMSFRLNGSEIAIPKSLYSDCFEPNLERGYVEISFRDNFNSIVVSMSGSDGAGGYQVRWRLRANRHHSRSISTF